MSNGFFRKKKVYFTQVSNTALRDKRLSLQAKGLYAIIQSYITIEDFVLYKNHLIKESGLSTNTFDKYWKELKNTGYLIQHKYYSSGNKGAIYEYELLDEPQEVFTPQNLRSKNLTPKNFSPKKIGGFNNTDLNNTNLNNTNCTTQNNASSKNKDLIEAYTHLLLTDNMSRQVVNWNYERLEAAIKIFKKEEGKYFSLLKKIYLDNGNFSKKNTSSASEEVDPKSFNNFTARNYDYDELEKKLLGWD